MIFVDSSKFVVGSQLSDFLIRLISQYLNFTPVGLSTQSTINYIIYETHNLHIYAFLYRLMIFYYIPHIKWIVPKWRI